MSLASGKVAVVSDAIWHEQFAGNPDAIGKALVLNREKYTVIGVMPGSFGYPFEGDIPYVAPGFRRTEVWIPLALDGARRTDRTNFDNVSAAIGRLRPGICEASSSRTHRTEKRLDVLNPAGPMQGWVALVAPFTETILGPVTKMLWLLMAAVGLVLMIACGNVANLLLPVSPAGSRRLLFVLGSVLAAIAFCGRCSPNQWCWLSSAAQSEWSLLSAPFGFLRASTREIFHVSIKCL